MRGGGMQIWERPLARNTTWPTTRLARWSLSLLLTAGLYFPGLAGRAHEWQWLAFLPATVAIALATRMLFGALGVLPRLRNWSVRATAAMLPALLATSLMAGASAIMGLAWSPPLEGLSFAISIVTLATAAGLREAEIRAQLGLRRVYFIGSAGSQLDLQRELGRCRDHQLVGSRISTELVDSLEATALEADVLASGATIVILDREAARLEGIEETTACLRTAGLWIGEFASFYEAEFKKVPLAELASVQGLADAASGSRRVLHQPLCRMFEIFSAGMLLLIALPVLLLAGLVIRLTSDGPALYRQPRVGRGDIPFTLLKLRTMTTSLQPEASWAQCHVHRVTWIGRHLRRFRVDELPQLWNVLRGELALVGPRPEQVAIVERLRQELPYYGVRHCVRPGLTGWAQVNLGYAGSVEGTLAKLQRDVFYVKRRSLRLDVLIIWLTLKTVLSGQGSSCQFPDVRQTVDGAAEQKSEAPREMHRDEYDR